MMKIVPKLPDSEKYDLKDQLARSSKAIPRLIAEGYAKRLKTRFQNDTNYLTQLPPRHPHPNPTT